MGRAPDHSERDENRKQLVLLLVVKSNERVATPSNAAPPKTMVVAVLSSSRGRKVASLFLLVIVLILGRPQNRQVAKTKSRSSLRAHTVGTKGGEANFLASTWQEACEASRHGKIKRPKVEQPASKNATEGRRRQLSEESQTAATIIKERKKALESKVVACTMAIYEEPYLTEWAEYNLRVLNFAKLYVYDNSDIHELRQWGQEAGRKVLRTRIAPNVP